ncbi:hypothetical protein EYZ11_009393 [Aspergillus tanneri]|uniref:AMP-dependent synthetase/ligase domain-containing protein n=1 Tax=Aspergillus tanneri TaxID=1220188 RepID=A0A4S3J7Z9_9EURO|nr:hypothetical protein EYZ11_009393 [Aspergillus tanneri]
MLCIRQGSTKVTKMFEQWHVLTHATCLTHALGLDIQLQSRELSVEANFDPKVLPQAEAQTMLHQLRRIFRQVERHPSHCLKNIDLVSPEDRLQLQTWNGSLPQALEVCVHEAIQEQCLARPDSIAVSAWDGSFLYCELDTYSTVLARKLAGYQVGPDVFVPVYFERTHWTTVVMLGILRAGGALLLMDPSHQIERLREICRDAQAFIVLASTATKCQDSRFGPKVLAIGDNETDWRQSNGTYRKSHTRECSPMAWRLVLASTLGYYNSLRMHLI